MSAITIRFGGYQAPDSINTRAAVRFGEVIERELGSRVHFELIGSVLAIGRPSGDLPRMVAEQELDLCYISTVRFTREVPELGIFELPYVVRDRARLLQAIEGPLGARFAKAMEANTPFLALGFWDNGFRHITNRVRPIRMPEDCRGLRIRTQVSDLHGESMSALGFIPIPVDVKEFAEQVATDRFQAQENPLTNTYNFNVHRYHRYITLTGHFFGMSALICGKSQYAQWPADVQQAVQRAAREATAFEHRIAATEEDEILAKLDPKENEVLRLSDAERAAFRRAVEPVLEKHRKSLDPKLFEYLA